MKSDERSLEVAVIQASTPLFGSGGAVDKACRLIAEAGSSGARLLLLPEAFIGGYPRKLPLAQWWGTGAGKGASCSPATTSVPSWSRAAGWNASARPPPVPVKSASSGWWSASPATPARCTAPPETSGCVSEVSKSLDRGRARLGNGSPVRDERTGRMCELGFLQPCPKRVPRRGCASTR